MNATVTTALAAALVVAGGAFDSASLYVPGVALLALAGGAVAWVHLATRGARVERAAGPETVAEGEPYPLSIHLRGGLLPPRGELVDPLLERPLAISFGRGWIRARIRRTEMTVGEEVRFEHRGRHRLEAPRLIVRDPLGLCSRTVEGRAAGEVLVLPRIEPVRAGGGRASEGREAVAGADDGSGAGLSFAHDVEIDGLRPYRQGSPASRIHWPAVARHGELIERQLASGGEGTALVVLDAERPASPDALDRAVRAAASLCVHLARAGGCTLVAPGSSGPVRIDPKLRGWHRAHVCLALVEPGNSPARMARVAGGRATFWVTATKAGKPPRRLARARGSFIVTPFAPARGGAAFTVAGCHGRSLAAPRRAAKAWKAA